MFNNQQQGGNNLFGQGGGNPLFNNQQQQNTTGNNPFAPNQNQGQGTNMYQTQNNQGQNTLFNNQGQGQGLFNQQGQTGQGTNNIFQNQGGNNQQQGGMFQNQNAQGNNLFQNQNTQGNNMFQNTQQQGNNLFQNTQGNNMYNQQGTMYNQQGQQGNQYQSVGGNNLFTGQQGNQQQFMQNQMVGTNPQYQNMNMQNTTLPPALQRQYANKQIQQNIKTLGTYVTVLQKGVTLDDSNIYKNMRVNQAVDFKQDIMLLMKNFKELKQWVDKIKKTNNDINKNAYNFTQSIRQKLVKYKQCLIENLAQNAMVEEITKQVQAMDDQIEHFLRPLFNAYKNKGYFKFSDPDDFSLAIAHQCLKKIQILSDKVDDIIACRNSNDQFGSIQVFEQLIEYYQNVASSFRQFSIKYNQYKRQAIQKRRRGPYDEVMRKINEKRTAGLGKNFYYYDLVKQIDTILEQKEKRQEQFKHKH